MKNEELKPCPFCGGKAVFRVRSNKSSHYSAGFDFEVKCVNCGAKLPKLYTAEFSLTDNGELKFLKDERVTAIEDWNGRG